MSEALLFAIQQKDSLLNEQLKEINRLREIIRKKDEVLNIDVLADKIHSIWARWYKHQRDNSTPENIKRWEYQSKTTYADLSEEDKEKDRKIVREFLEVYKDNLAFEPKMTMEQVFKIAVDEYGWEEERSRIAKCDGGFSIDDTGAVEFYEEYERWNKLARNRTPEEVLMIIKGLGK